MSHTRRTNHRHATRIVGHLRAERKASQFCPFQKRHCFQTLQRLPRIFLLTPGMLLAAVNGAFLHSDISSCRLITMDHEGEELNQSSEIERCDGLLTGRLRERKKSHILKRHGAAPRPSSYGPRRLDCFRPFRNFVSLIAFVFLNIRDRKTSEATLFGTSARPYTVSFSDSQPSLGNRTENDGDREIMVHLSFEFGEVALPYLDLRYERRSKLLCR